MLHKIAYYTPFHILYYSKLYYAATYESLV